MGIESGNVNEVFGGVRSSISSGLVESKVDGDVIIPESEVLSLLLFLVCECFPRLREPNRIFTIIYLFLSNFFSKCLYLNGPLYIQINRVECYFF